MAATSHGARADVQLNSLFAGNMVLQRGRESHRFHCSQKCATVSRQIRLTKMGTILGNQKSNQAMKLTNCRVLCALSLSVPAFLVAHTATAQTSVATKHSVKGASWIALQVRTDKTQYASGEPIKVALKATNIQSKDAYLKFSSGQRFDLQLFKAGVNEPVYTWSANKMFATMIGHVKLKQGQSESYAAEIGSEMGALAPGNYRLEAHLTNSSQISAPPLKFAVVARATAANQAGATLTATTDKTAYNAGETVKIAFTLQNNEKKPMNFEFNSGQTYDVFVRDSKGEQIWNWGANKRFAMIMRTVTLAAGEKQQFSVEWDGRALPDKMIAPGKYTVQVVYTSKPELRAAPIEIEIR